LSLVSGQKSMKKLLTSLTFLSLFGINLIAQTGTIKGRVLDENGLGMPGANVFLEDFTIATITNQSGDFTMFGVAEGSKTLNISYIGYSSVTQQIEVKNGQTSTLNIKMVPGIELGTEILILGDRLKGQAKAINQQRTNTNITNIVAADQIGRFPDANIGDAMKRITGITMQNDQGEARNIIIRGMASALNSVMINGERVPSAEGDNRNIQMDLIPADMIQTIEVNKAVLPDMDADAIGGSVNLVTRKAPNGLRVSGTAGTGLNLLSNKPIWNGSLIIGDRFANGKLGIVFSGSYHNHTFGSDNIEAAWVKTDNPKYPVVIEQFDLRKYDVQRVRRSSSIALDFDINANHSIAFNAMYNWRDDWENRYRFRADRLERPIESGGFEELSNGVYRLSGRTAIQTKGGIDNDRTKMTRLEDQRVTNLTLSGNHLFNKLNMTWSATYAKASEDRPNERYITHRSNSSVVVDINDPFKPLVTYTNQDSELGLNLNEIYESNNNTFEEDFNSRLDFSLPISSNKGYLKFGGRLRSKSKERNDTYDVYDPKNDLGSGGNKLGNLPFLFQTNREFLNGSQYVPGRFIDRSFLGNLDLYNSSLFDYEDAQAEYISGNYTANETILATYAMAKYNFSDKFSGIVGVRLESTNIEYQGYEFDEDEEIAKVSPKNNETFLNIMPSLHLKYDFTDNNVLRFAYTNTMARPNYFDLVPYAIYSAEDESLSRGNPDLNPTTSMNLDLMYESYFKSIGLFSLGAFYKDVNNFIYNRTFLNVTDPQYGFLNTLSRPENGGTADVTGLEIAFQRQLDFLPGILKGLGLYVNYTFTNSTTTGVEGRESEDLVLPGTAKNMFNASLSFETEKLVLRLSLNYASDYLDELGDETFNDIFYDKQTFVDANASYAISNKWRIFAEANNLTNQPLRYYQGIRSRTFQEEFYNSRFNIGIKFDFFGNAD